MSRESTDTIFISGLSMKSNPKDKIVFLGLVDGVASKNIKIHNFVLPESVSIKLLKALLKIHEDLDLNEDLESELSDSKEESELSDSEE